MIVGLTTGGARADIGLIALERIGSGKFLYGTGHSALQLSHVCMDGSPIRLRMCDPGEPGVILQRYAGIGEENYDWLATPPSYFFHGVESGDRIPLFANPEILERLLEQSFTDLRLGEVLRGGTDGDLPDGNWRFSIGQALRRTNFVFTLKDTVEDERRIMNRFNAMANVSRFNGMRRNCSDLLLDAVRKAYPEASRGIAGLGMTTPKGLAREAERLARANRSEPLLLTSIVPQLPGTYPRSSANLYPLENNFRNPLYAVPFAALLPPFTGFSILFHTVANRFSVPRAWRRYATPELARLTFAQASLREERDRLAREISWLAAGGAGRRLDEARRRADEIHKELRRMAKSEALERDRVFGADAVWQDRRAQFSALLRRLSERPEVPPEARGILRRMSGMRAVSQALFDLFLERGTYGFDGDGRLIMTLTPEEGGPRRVGITRGNVLEGDEALGVLVLAGNVGSRLASKWRQRDVLERFEEDWALLQQAASRLQ